MKILKLHFDAGPSAESLPDRRYQSRKQRVAALANAIAAAARLDCDIELELSSVGSRRAITACFYPRSADQAPLWVHLGTPEWPSSETTLVKQALASLQELMRHEVISPSVASAVDYLSWVQRGDATLAAAVRRPLQVSHRIIDTDVGFSLEGRVGPKRMIGAAPVQLVATVEMVGRKKAKLVRLKLEDESTALAVGRSAQLLIPDDAPASEIDLLFACARCAKRVRVLATPIFSLKTSRLVSLIWNSTFKIEVADCTLSVQFVSSGDPQATKGCSLGTDSAGGKDDLGDVPNLGPRCGGEQIGLPFD
jgi:hypothetical protein